MTSETGLVHWSAVTLPNVNDTRVISAAFSSLKAKCLLWTTHLCCIKNPHAGTVNSSHPLKPSGTTGPFRGLLMSFLQDEKVRTDESLLVSET